MQEHRAYEHQGYGQAEPVECFLKPCIFDIDDPPWQLLAIQFTADTRMGDLNNIDPAIGQALPDLKRLGGFTAHIPRNIRRGENDRGPVSQSAFARNRHASAPTI